MFAKQAAKGKRVAAASPDRQSLSNPVSLPDSDSAAQSSAAAALCATKDSKPAIEIDASPTKKRRLDPSHEGPTQADTQSLPAKKRVKRSASSGGSGGQECLESGLVKTQGPSDDMPPSNSMTQSKSRTKGIVKASSSSPNVSVYAFRYMFTRMM